jgi:hypothetical protein
MTEYLTMDLLWVLYCAFLEDKFPNASKPSKERFIGAVQHLIEIEEKGTVLHGRPVWRPSEEEKGDEVTNLGVKIPRSRAHC